MLVRIVQVSQSPQDFDACANTSANLFEQVWLLEILRLFSRKAFHHGLDNVFDGTVAALNVIVVRINLCFFLVSKGKRLPNLTYKF